MNNHCFLTESSQLGITFRECVAVLHTASPEKLQKAGDLIESLLSFLMISGSGDSVLYQISKLKNFRNATVVNITAKKQSSSKSTIECRTVSDKEVSAMSGGGASFFGSGDFDVNRAIVAN